MEMKANLNEVSSWKNSPWPWFLLLFPAVAVIAGIITISLAIRTEDGLVSSDYYKEGLAINRVIKREANADKLNIKAEGQYVSDTHRIRLKVTGNTSFPSTLSLRLIHPTQVNLDQAIVLSVTANGWYEGYIANISPSHWKMSLEDKEGHWKLNGEWNTINNSGLTFKR